MKTKIIALSTLLVGASANAGTITEDITAGIASGQANVTLVVSGVIAMAALAFGIGMVTGFLRR